MEQQLPQEHQQSFFRFEDLRVYEKAVDYATWMSNAISEPKNSREKALIESFCHSSFDISLNIVEGASRAKNQFDNFLKISKVAIRECVAYTEMAKKLDLFTEENYQQSRELLMELTRMVGALIASLQRSGGHRSRRDDDSREKAEDNLLNDDIQNDLSF